VAQWYKRSRDGRFTFRVPSKPGFWKPAKEYVGHDNGWACEFDVLKAIRAADIPHHVPIDEPA
jgi:hypothetical protein